MFLIILIVNLFLNKDYMKHTKQVKNEEYKKE